MRNLGFYAASASLISLFTAASCPIPLYALYRQTEGLTYSDMSLATVFYCAGAMTALLFFGRLSDYLGRKPITLLAISLSALSCLLFMHINGVVPLLIARVLQGLSCGLATSTITSYVADNGPKRFPWLTTTVVGCAPMVGITLGSMGTGALMEYVPLPWLLPFVIVLMMNLGCGWMVWRSPETVTKVGFRAGYLIPSFRLPANSKAMFPVACCTLITTWAVGGFYQSFSPVIATDQLGTQNAVVSGAILAILSISSAFGGPLTQKVSPASTQKLGLGLLVLSLIAIIITLQQSMIELFLVASAVAGVAQGIAITGALRGLFAGVPNNSRAGIFSAVYSVCYFGAAVPSLTAGQLAKVISMIDILGLYAVLIVLGFAVVWRYVKNPQPVVEVEKSNTAQRDDVVEQGSGHHA